MTQVAVESRTMTLTRAAFSLRPLLASQLGRNSWTCLASANQLQVVAESIRLNDFVVDMSDSDASDPSHCVFDARVNAA